MTLSRNIIAGYWAHRDHLFSADAIEAAKIALADSLAVTMAAPHLEPVTRPFTDHVLALGGVGRSDIIGARRKCAAPLAALANGALAHALDFEDTFEPGMIHPNASLIPSVLALAQAEEARGEDILGALIIGCDFACRLSLAIDGDPTQRGWYHPPIISGLGATLGAAWLAGLTEQQALDALGLFAAQFMLGDELKRSPHSHLRAVREGLAARAAVEAVLLARCGVRAVEQPLEGPSGVFALLTGRPPCSDPWQSGLGQRFYGPEVSLKRWPCCRGTHSAIVAARALRDKGISASYIQQVAVIATPPNDMLFEPRDSRVAPQTPIDAKFSIPFVFSTAITDGAVGLSSFTPEKLKVNDTLSLAARVEMASLDAAGGFEAIYDVTLMDGTVHRQTVTTVPAWRTGDASLSELRPKVGDCLRAGAQLITLDAYFRAVSRIEDDGVEPLMRLL